MNDHTDISYSGIPEALDFSMSDTFTQHSEIATRGYCTLYRAMRHGRWFVLKGLRPEHLPDPLYMALLEKEYNVMATLDHPNIVHLYGHETDSVVGPCIVMEYVDGRTMAEFLKEKPSLAARHRVMIQLLNAMTYCHTRQVVHRDLKPSNILVTHNGDNVKLIDFGLADADDYAVLKEPAHTEGYAAPEQKVNGATIDCRTDIYAFGVLLRQLFPHRYRHIARRCTRSVPTKRYPSATAVNRAILHCRSFPYIIVGLVLLAILSALMMNRGHSVPLVSTPQPEPITDTTTVFDTFFDNDTIPPVVHQKNKPQEVRTLHVEEATTELQQYADSQYSIFIRDVNNGRYSTEDAALQYEAAVYTRVVNKFFELLIKHRPSNTDEWKLYNDPMQEIISQARDSALMHIDKANLPSRRDYLDDSSKVQEYRQATAEYDKELNIFYQICKQYSTEVLDNMRN